MFVEGKKWLGLCLHFWKDAMVSLFSSKNDESADFCIVVPFVLLGQKWAEWIIDGVDNNHCSCRLKESKRCMTVLTIHYIRSNFTSKSRSRAIQYA